MTTEIDPSTPPSLDALRAEIDAADLELLKALRRRLDAVRAVADHKRGRDAPIRDAGREQAIQSRWASLATEAGLNPHAVGRVLREVLGWSRREQERAWRDLGSAEIRVAYQGMSGAHSELAACELMVLRGRVARMVGKTTFDDVLRALREGQVEYALVPVENSIVGGIQPVHALLMEGQAHIVDEEPWDIRHVLAVVPGTELADVRSVVSHPVALRQCRRTLTESLGLTTQEIWDTAAAARAVAVGAEPSLAAVCSAEAAVQHGLQILRDDVSDHPDNRTRFLLLARDPEPMPPGVAARTTLRLIADHRPGSLARCLGAFADHGVNLNGLVSLMLPGRPGQYGFLVDIDGAADDEPVAQALVGVRQEARQLTVLGSYPNRSAERHAPVQRPNLAETPAVRPSVPGASKPQSSLPLVSRADSQRSHALAGIPIGGDSFVLIAGPCAVETPEQIATAAEMVHRAGAALLRGGAFKPRTSTYSFQGLGMPGIDLLVDAGRRNGLPVVTEVLQAKDVGAIAARADVLQVGARNMQNFELLRALGRIDRPVLLKRGMSASINELLHAAEYILAGGNQQVVLCERGIRTFETSTRATLDVAAVPVLKQRTHLPVIVDPSHAAGKRALVVPLALAAAAAGADGLIVECHPNPEAALCDKDQALTEEDLLQLVTGLRPILAGQGRSLA